MGYVERNHLIAVKAKRILSLVKQEMTTSDYVYCNLCAIRHYTTEAAIWCQDCEEALCQCCDDHHKLSRASRNHITIPIEDFRKLPPFILEIKYLCEEHNENKKQYCIFHECLLCTQCTKITHKNCKDIIMLDDVIQYVKSSAAIDCLEKRVENLSRNLQRLLEDREVNLSSIHKQQLDFKESMLQIRNQINYHFDILEKEICENLTSAVLKEQREIEVIINELQEQRDNVNGLQSHMDGIKKYASNFQTFLGTKEIEKKVFEVEQYIQLLYKNSKLNQVSFSFKVERQLMDLSSFISRVGEIFVESNQPVVTLLGQNAPQVFINRSDKHLVPSLNLKLTQQIVGKKITHITGCCFLSNSDAILLAGDDYVEIYKRNATINDCINIEKKIYCVTRIDANTIAMSSGSNKHIYIVDIQKREVSKIIDMTTSCSGISCQGNSLLYCVEDKGLFTTNLNDLKFREVYKDNLSWLSNVTYFSNNICVTNSYSGTVTALDSDFKVLWTFKEPNAITYPCGITSDDRGTVFVTGYCSNNVIAISLDGKKYAQLLSERDGLRKPFAIHYDSQRLLVANYKGPVFLYDIC